MKKTFSIVCITTRSANDSVVSFHLQAPANTVVLEDGRVEYNGKIYPLKYVDRGLSSSAVLLGLVDGDGVLELYTDTPAEGSNATPESIRDEARRTMKARQLHQQGDFRAMIAVMSGNLDPESVK